MISFDIIAGRTKRAPVCEDKSGVCDPQISQINAD